MANSMDKIVVKYGVSVVDGEDFKEREKKLRRAKTVSITDFFNVSPDELTETERKVQNALKLIYEINEKDPPLFQKFPDFRSDESGARRSRRAFQWSGARTGFGLHPRRIAG